mmetsp:Transcript_1157/g.2098  ORF Transcript_1157/g.2098 Transcript_1157/m.2098 type:complete len:333 (+) Transcript_1157:82-1080(+)
MAPMDELTDYSQSAPTITSTSSGTQRQDSNHNNTKSSKKQRNIIMNSLRKRVNAGKVSYSSMDEQTKQEMRIMRRKNRHLVEQHYKIDQENHVLLPGVPTYDEDLARDFHDFFNLICLVPIIALNVLNWDWDKLFQSIHSKEGIPFIHCWTGEYFYLFFYVTLAYFIVDLVWVTVIPRAVKSPSTIIQHHIATILYLIIPFHVQSFRFLMGVCMSVEMNTWFLIARRVFNKQGFPPWTIDLPYLFSVRVKLISICFYITWISIRCVLYPYVLVVFYKMVQSGNLRENERMFMPVGTCLHSVFCVLNVRWTIDLINSKIRQWKTKTNDIASGL